MAKRWRQQDWERELERLEQQASGKRAPAKPPRTFGERVLGVVRLARHPIRAGAMAMAGLALAWGMATGSGLVAVMLGAVAGVALGELLARTSSRMITVLLGLAAGCALAWWAADRITHWRIIPALVGPGAALNLSSLLRFFVISLTAVGGLRTLAARHPALVGLEVAAVGASVAAMFATHRDGVIARPLWLSDWAWQHGYDPADVLLSVGAAAVLVLAGLLIAESERRVSLASLAGIAVVVFLELSLLSLEGLPEPQANSDLGLTESQMGDPPKPTEGGGRGPGAEEPDPDDAQGGQGQKPDESEQQGGGGGQQQQQEQGGGQGQQQQEQQGGQQQREQGGGQGQQQEQQQGGEQQQQQGEQQQGEQQQGGQQQQGEQQQGEQQQQQEQQGGGGQSEQEDQSEQPQLDGEFSEGTAPAPMAVVLLGDDYSPPMQSYYFRQDAWSHFNGSRLLAPRRPDVDRDIVRRFPARPVDVAELPPGEALADELLTEVHTEVVLLAKHAQPFALESATAMKPEPNPNPARFLRAYSVVSLAPAWEPEQLAGRDAGNPEWTDAQLEFYTRPSDDPRFGELAQEIIAELPESRRGDPFVEALAVKLWMDEQLTYSTAERHAGVPDPTADFLFGNRIGYCVHFAHAAVFMWRSLGIPARVGTGYMVTEDQRRGSTIVIRGGDAHAWPELYLDGVGWVILDISAAENLDPPGQPIADDLTDLLGDMARNETDEEGERAEGPVERRSFGRDLGLAVLNFIVLFLAWLYLVKLWRRVAPRFARQRKLPAVSYRAVVDRLTDAGLTRAYGETREAFARRVAKQVPSLAGLTSMHVAARFGDPRRELGERPEFDPRVWEKGLRDIRAELPLSIPRWRRVLGVLDPTTVLRAR